MRNDNMQNKFNPAIHHRKSIRLKDYDYSQKGAYYVTICVNNMVCLFGEVVSGTMVLNDAGNMVDAFMNTLHNKFHHIKIDEYVIMPNHVHGIILINDVDGIKGEYTGSPLRNDENNNVGADQRVCPHMNQVKSEKISLPRIMQWFKTMTTNAYILGVKQSHWPSFDGRLWQRNYYEHVIRNDDELNKIREYIIQNPDRWDE